MPTPATPLILLIAVKTCRLISASSGCELILALSCHNQGHAQSGQYVGDVVGDSMRRRTGKKKARGLLGGLLYDEGPGIAPVGELAGRTHDQHLVGERGCEGVAVFVLVVDIDVGCNVKNPAFGVTGRAASLFDQHSSGGSHWAGGCERPDARHKDRTDRRRREELGYCAIDFVEAGRRNSDEFRKGGHLIGRLIAAVEQALLKDGSAQRNHAVFGQHVVITKNEALSTLRYHRAKRSSHHKIVSRRGNLEPDRSAGAHGPAPLFVVRCGTQLHELPRGDDIGRQAVHLGRKLLFTGESVLRDFVLYIESHALRFGLFT